MRQMRTTAGLLRILQVFDNQSYSVDKADDQYSADEDDQVGRKKGENKRKRVFQVVGGNEHVHTEKEKTASHDDQQYLSDKPKGTHRY